MKRWFSTNQENRKIKILFGLGGEEEGEEDEEEEKGREEEIKLRKEKEWNAHNEYLWLS